MLSEHTMEEMLEGYLLTGRHGFLSFYEAFVHSDRFHVQSTCEMAVDLDAAI